MSKEKSVKKEKEVKENKTINKSKIESKNINKKVVSKKDEEVLKKENKKNESNQSNKSKEEFDVKEDFRRFLEQRESLTEEEIEKQKEKEMKAALSKQKKLDTKLRNEALKKQEIENLEKVKNQKSGIKLIYLIILLTLVIFVSIMYSQNPEKFNINNIKNGILRKEKTKDALPENERVGNIQRYLRERKTDYDDFLLGDTSKLNEIIPNPENVVKYFEEEGWYIPEIDKSIENYVFIGDRTIVIEDLDEINNNKMLKEMRRAEAQDLNDIDPEKPNLIFPKDKVLVVGDAIVVKMKEEGGSSFDGFTDGNNNPVVIGYDLIDRDITDNIQLIDFNPETWEHGKEYIVKYKLTNSRGETIQDELKVLCAPKLETNETKELN